MTGAFEWLVMVGKFVVDDLVMVNKLADALVNSWLVILGFANDKYLNYYSDGY